MSKFKDTSNQLNKYSKVFQCKCKSNELFRIPIL